MADAENPFNGILLMLPKPIAAMAANKASLKKMIKVSIFFLHKMKVHDDKSDA